MRVQFSGKYPCWYGAYFSWGVFQTHIICIGISIISSHFPAGRAKNKAFAVLGAGQPVGFIIGMILGTLSLPTRVWSIRRADIHRHISIGGILSESSASWRTIFWLQAGLAFILCIGGWYVLPADDVSQRYDMGLDWIGAILSTAGLGLLVCDLAYVFLSCQNDLVNDVNDSESTTTPRGWATPFVPSLFGISIILIMSFVAWEMRREAKGQSVLLPMSMWTQPGTKMGPIILLVFFGWWGFNTLAYFVPLFYQEVLLLTPLQTAVRLVPMGVSVSSVDDDRPLE